MSSLVSVAVLFAGALVLAQPQQPVFRSSVRTVPIYATVIDANGRLVPGPRAGGLRGPRQRQAGEVTLFSNESQPFTAVVMLDTSASMTGQPQAAQPRRRAVPAAAAAGRPRAGRRVQRQDPVERHVHQRSRRADQRARTSLQFGNSDAAERRHRRQPRRAQGRRRPPRRAGVHRRRRHRQPAPASSTVLERARDEEVMVYSIGLESELLQRRARGALAAVTRPAADRRRDRRRLLRAGEERRDLSPTFTRVAQELRSQYLIGFAPDALDSKVHKLDVRVNAPGHDRAGPQELSGGAREEQLADKRD